MKKVFLLVLFICFNLIRINAQSDFFSRGTAVLNMGVGLGSTWYAGTYYTVNVPPVSASLEFAIADYVLERGSIGLGPYVGYSKFKFEKGDGGYNYTDILTGVRCNFHYPLFYRLDTYASLFLGYNFLNHVEFDTPMGLPETGGLRSAFYVGGRFYFSEIVALMAEAGYGITYFNVGLAVKFDLVR